MSSAARPDLPREDLHRWQRLALGTGIAASAAAAAGAVLSTDQFLRSYLWAFLFWFGIALGGLPILLLHSLVGGAWGTAIRRAAESSMRTIPLVAVLFLPILIGVHGLYSWSHEAEVEASPILQHKQPYLNIPFWAIRAGVYFSVWTFLAFKLVRKGSGAAEDAAGLERLGGPGLVLYAFTVTFAAFDWAMSLEPEWFSTIYGMQWIVGQFLSALAFAVLVSCSAGAATPEPGSSAKANLDLGNLMLAFVMLWAYLSFAQFLVTWYGNLPEEIRWYLSRLRNGWGLVAAGLLLLHFAVPFALLLSRHRKQSTRAIAAIAGWILLMRALDMFWLISPAFSPEGFHVHWLDLVLPAAIGGLWLAYYLAKLPAAGEAP